MATLSVLVCARGVAASSESQPVDAELSPMEAPDAGSETVLLGAIGSVPRYDFWHDDEDEVAADGAGIPGSDVRFSRASAVVVFDLGFERNVRSHPFRAYDVDTADLERAFGIERPLSLSTWSSESDETMETVLHNWRMESSGVVSLAGGLLLHETSRLRLGFGVAPPPPETPSDWGMVMRLSIEF